MDSRALFEEQKSPLFNSQGEVHVEALGNPLQTALSLASSYYFTNPAAAQSHFLGRQAAHNTFTKISAAVDPTASRQLVAATAAGNLVSEVDNAGIMTFAAEGGRRSEEGDGEVDIQEGKEEDTRMRERSLEKSYTGGEGENRFYTESEDRNRGSGDNNNNDSLSSNNDMRGANDSASLMRNEAQQQQQETSCEEEVSTEEEVETVDGTSTATEGETEAESELYYSEESEQERDEEIDDGDDEEVYDKDGMDKRSVAFCDAFAGLLEVGKKSDWEGKQQLQQACTTAITQSAAITPTRERSKRKFASASFVGNDGMMLPQEQRGRKGDKEEGFCLQKSKRSADVDIEEVEEQRQSSRKSRREAMHLGQELFLEKKTNSAAFSPAFYSPGCKRRDSYNAQDTGIISRSDMQWQSSKRRDIYRSSIPNQQQCGSIAENTDAMLRIGNKRRNSSRSVSGLRAKVRRRASEAGSHIVASSSSSSRAAANVIAGNRERYSVSEVMCPEAAATGQVGAAEADPLARLARRTEELLLMHSKRFMEEQHKC